MIEILSSPTWNKLCNANPEMATKKNIRKKRNSRFFKLNRELLVFSIFLLVAIIFWFIQTFKNTTSVSLDYRLQLNGIPNSLVYTSEVPERIKVRLYGRGFNVLKLLFSSSNDRVVEVDYSLMKDTSKALIIDSDIWKRSFSKVLPSGVSVNEQSIQTIEIFYSSAEQKKLPVIFKGKMTTAKDYVVGDIILKPEYVDVYAPVNVYDTITVINTNQIELNNLEDTLDIQLKLNPPMGVKCIPDTVHAKICVDLQSTKQISVPIYTLNSPQNIVLKPFPMTATVTYQVSASKYNSIKDTEFNAVIDYLTIKENDTQCKVNLTAIPEGVSNVRYSPHNVEFVIEQVNNASE